MAGIFKTWAALAKNSKVVHEIRLKRDGTFIEIGFLNYMGVPKEKNWFTLPIIDLVPPPTYGESGPIMAETFPASEEEFEIPSEDVRLPWIKYYDVVRSYFYVPKEFDYIDRELMIHIMNGENINTLNIK